MYFIFFQINKLEKDKSKVNTQLGDINNQIKTLNNTIEEKNTFITQLVPKYTHLNICLFILTHLILGGETS